MCHVKYIYPSVYRWKTEEQGKISMKNLLKSLYAFVAPINVLFVSKNILLHKPVYTLLIAQCILTQYTFI